MKQREAEQRILKRLQRCREKKYTGTLSIEIPFNQGGIRGLNLFDKKKVKD